jgi:hypothetical protein
VNHSPKLGFLFRIGAALFVIAALGLAAAAPKSRALAAPGVGGLPADAPRPAQQATSYPAGGDVTDTPESGGAYPAGTNAPEETATEGPSPVFTATAAVTAGPTATPTITGTPPPNVFQTENSEMGGSLVTPPASETPGPTLTAVYTATALSGTAQPTQVASAGTTGGSGFVVDWGLFWVGFSIPILFGCGMVLYLLDRKPSLFR